MSKYIYHVELHEQHTERLLYQSEGMTKEEAERIKTLLNQSAGEDAYVYISVKHQDI